MAETTESIRNELAARHRTAAWTVYGMLGLTLVLVALALAGIFVNKSRARDPNLDTALRMMVVFFAFGAMAFRRTKFNAARLQDIAAVRGVSALLATLQNTTMLVALLGGAIAFIGFIIAMGAGSGTDMLWIGGVAAVVLFYAYPRRSAWQRVVEATQTTGGSVEESSAKGTNA